MWSVIPHPVPMVLALVLDKVLGDLSNRFHPVAWMGAAIGVAHHWAPRRGRFLPLVYGATLVLIGMAVTAAVGYGVFWLLPQLPQLLAWLLEAMVLKLTIRFRGLAQAANRVRLALEANALPQACRLVRCHLVSCETSHFSHAEVVAATVESVAENASNGIVAPLFYYAMGGLPGALVYRFINTADSMLGYRDVEFEWLGKVPARLDDGLNLIPARLTAFLLVLATLVVGGRTRLAWQVWRREAQFTESPNTGHPMSSMAGALGVELEKFGHYRLGAGYRFPEVPDIAKAVRLAYASTVLSILFISCLIGLLHYT